jgi:predicted S18 family serine protease
LISRRGVGKTFSVLRELTKLSQLPDCAGYTTFLYVSDKTNGATVNELISHIQLRARVVNYNEILIVLQDLIDAKSAYENILNKNIQDCVFDETKQDLFETLDLEE